MRSVSVSDKYGRKRVLLCTMLGNILSAIIWTRSTSFVSCSCCPPSGLHGREVDINAVHFLAVSLGRRSKRGQRPTQHVNALHLPNLWAVLIVGQCNHIRRYRLH